MLIIPIAPRPSQVLAVTLAGQVCKIAIASKSTGLFLDLYVNSAPVAVSMLCHDRDRLVRNDYAGFAGDLAFCDTAGTDDPQAAGLGSRWLLVYLTVDDLAAGLVLAP